MSSMILASAAGAPLALLPTMSLVPMCKSTMFGRLVKPSPLALRRASNSWGSVHFGKYCEMAAYQVSPIQL